MSEKKGLMTIGEIAKTMELTRRMIINYEDRGLITSDLREGDGYRYYTLDTLTRIRTIRIFQKMGLTLDEIREYFDDSSDLTPMLERLEALRDELNLNIEKIRERIKTADAAAISFIAIPRQTICRRKFRSASVAERTIKLRESTFEAIREYGSDITRRMFFIEYELRDPEAFSCCAAVPAGSEGTNIEELPETQAICIYHHGAYEELPAVRDRLLAYAKERQLEPLGTCHHIYLEGPPQHKDPKKFITQVALPIMDRRRNG